MYRRAGDGSPATEVTLPRCSPLDQSELQILPQRKNGAEKLAVARDNHCQRDIVRRSQLSESKSHANRGSEYRRKSRWDGATSSQLMFRANGLQSWRIQTTRTAKDLLES